MKKIYYNGHVIHVFEEEYANYHGFYTKKIYIVEVDDSNHDTLQQAKSWIDHLTR